MMDHLDEATKPGLRDRKKARRRDEIIAAAKDLFTTNGIDATTMAEIAAASGISAPTVFNYFGSKDGILIAMITEGTREARDRDRGAHWRAGADLTTLIVELFLRVSARTLNVAGKRVWRYAEAAAIRHPDAVLSLEYRNVSMALHGVVAEFLTPIDLQTRQGGPCDAGYMAGLLIDQWMPCFIALITSEPQTLIEHEAILRARFAPLIGLIFTEACAAQPRLKGDKP